VRHMSPDEVWAAAELAGWEPMRVREDELAVLLRPYEIRTTRRGLVSLFGNSYHLRELEHHHGDQVQVGYDIHDAGRVWVADLAGRPLGVALLDGHARPYMPQTAIEAARAQRLRRRMETIEARAEEIRAEAGPGVLEHAPPVEIPEIEAAAADRLFAELDPVPEVVPVVVPVAGGRPAFSDEIEWAEWVLAAGPLVEDADRALLRRRMQSTSFRMLLGLDEDTEQDSAAG
jgi:putative transposase